MRRTLKAAHNLGVWHDRYRSGVLPADDNRSAHFVVYPSQPVSDSLADTIERWVTNTGWKLAVQRDARRA